MRTLRVRARRALVVAGLVLGASTLISPTPVAALGAIQIASKNFAGAEILSQVYGQALAAQGAQVVFQPDVGPTEVTFERLKEGAFDAYGEYQGTLLRYLGGKRSDGGTRTHAALETLLTAQGLVISKPAPAVDVNGFYVLRKTATEFKLTTVSDLKKVDQQLIFGGPPECVERPLCLGTESEQLYGLRFRKVRKLDTGGPVTGNALESGRIDVGVLFTASSVIPKNAVLLRDDKGLQPVDNPVMVLRKEAATPELLEVVDAVSAKITTAAYRKMSLDVSIRHHDPADVAATFLRDNNLP